MGLHIPVNWPAGQVFHNDNLVFRPGRLCILARNHRILESDPAPYLPLSSLRGRNIRYSVYVSISHLYERILRPLTSLL